MSALRARCVHHRGWDPPVGVVTCPESKALEGSEQAGPWAFSIGSPT